jgi:hypothetical protein
MIARKGLLGASSALALVGVALATAPDAEAACARQYYTGRAYGVFATTTGIAARADWRAEVSRHEGPEFTRWSRASKRTTRCTRAESGGRWYCRARAIPCDS